MTILSPTVQSVSFSISILVDPAVAIFVSRVFVTLGTIP